MTLADLIAEAEVDRTTIRVFAPAEYGDLTDRFDPWNVVVEHVTLPTPGGEGFVVVRKGGEFVGSIGLGALAVLARPPTEPPGARSGSVDEFRRLLELLDDTVFASFDRRQMLATAREIEDRAWRVGRGTLYTGFQSLSAMREQVPVYRHLATRAGLAVHAFGAPDWEPPAIEGVWLHRTDDPEITGVWFVVFDGGESPLDCCALLAEERDPGVFRGFWTYDPARVAAIVERVRGAMSRD